MKLQIGWIRILGLSLALAGLLGAPSGVQAASIDPSIPPGLLPAGEPVANPGAPLQAAIEGLAGSTTPAKPVTDVLRAAAPTVPEATIPQAPRPPDVAAGGDVMRRAGNQAVQGESSSRPASQSARAGSRAPVARPESSPGRDAMSQAASQPLTRAPGNPSAAGAETVAAPVGGGDDRTRFPLWPSAGQMTDWLPGWPLVAAGLMLLLGGVSVRRMTA